jgi:uncharacterized protein YsxB (DUF464 family)
MVKCLFENSNYGYISATIKNHAGDPKVCAGVSSLGMALVATLNNVGDLDIVKCDHYFGNIEVHINPFIDESKQSVVDTIFYTVYIGLKQLEEIFPEDIRVDVIRGNTS